MPPISLLLLLISDDAVATTAISDLTAYKALESFNFPAGLLPKGAVGYDLDESTGKFTAYLNGSCEFSLKGSYQLNYKPEIRGHIAKNKLSELTGINVKVLFLGLNIVEVSRNGDELEFSIGIASANFPIENFLESQECGCGLDCNGALGSRRTEDEDEQRWRSKFDPNAPRF